MSDTELDNYDAWNAWDDYTTYDHEWYGEIRTDVTGDLANRILARSGRDNGKVEIEEIHWNSGFCETCWSPETDFAVYVDNVPVWDSRRGDGYISFGETLGQSSAFIRWLDWLDEEGAD